MSGEPGEQPKVSVPKAEQAGSRWGFLKRFGIGGRKAEIETYVQEATEVVFPQVTTGTELALHLL